MSDVFISYSREDKVFVAQLREAFLQKAQEVWIDWESIPASQSWWEEIKRGIATANNFVVVMSPNSLSSPICHLEIEYARVLGKRIIPVFHAKYDRETCLIGITKRLAITDSSQDITRELWGNRQLHMIFDENQNALAPINYFFFTPEDNFAEKFDALMSIIQTDFIHKETHTRLGLRANKWANRDRDVSFLLDGVELSNAETWLDEALTKSKNPPPTEVQAAYIDASRADEEAQIQRLKNIRRARMIASITAGIMIIIALGAALVGINALNDVTIARNEIGTATQSLATAEANLVAINQEVVYAQATVTQVAVIEEIVTSFSDIILNTDNPDAQMAQMNQIITRYPNEPRAYSSRGLLYAQLGRYDEAITDFSEAIRLNPQIVTWYTNRGLAYTKIGDYDRAIADYTQAIDINSQDADAYFNRASAYLDMGSYDRAIADYTQAIDLNPTYTDAYNSRGILFVHTDDYDRAIADFSQAILSNPQYADSYENRGVAYYLATQTDIDPIIIGDYAQRGIDDFRMAESLGTLLSSDISDISAELEALLAEITPTPTP